MGNLLHYAIVFLIVAIIAAFLGFGGVAGTAMEGARLLFWIAIVLFVLALIGNFMRTTLHGGVKFRPHFTERVAKYSDNGGANTDAQLRNYFFEYFGRAPLDTLFHFMEVKSEDIFRKLIPMNTLPYRTVQNLYWKLK